MTDKPSPLKAERDYWYRRALAAEKRLALLTHPLSARISLGADEFEALMAEEPMQ